MSGYQYEAVFTNTVGNVTTSPATLTVQDRSSVTLQPTSQTVQGRHGDLHGGGQRHAHA